MNQASLDGVLQNKKQYFLNCVDKALLIYKLSGRPPVYFKEGFLPDGNRVRAHIHLDSKIICVSLSHLKVMTNEEIKETVFHEIEHIFIADHSSEFFEELGDSLRVSWILEKCSGVISINGNDNISGKKIKLENPIIDKEYCNNHQCRKKTKLYKCRFCGRYFCIDHIKPTTPGIPNIKNPNDGINWRNNDCHACPDFYDYLRKIYNEY